jgi:Xaa-Pro aminopeptidase
MTEQKIAQRKTETETKLTRLRSWMAEEGLDTVVLRRTASIAWITSGATTYVNTANGEGPVTAVVTATGAWLVANNIEAPRLTEEEGLDRCGWTVVDHPWHDAAKTPTPAGLTGSTMTEETSGADVPWPGTRNIGGAIARLRSRLLPAEQERMRRLAADCGIAIGEAAAAVRPGQSEHEIAGHLWTATQPRGIQAVVALVATDDRVRRFRHPLPTDKTLERLGLLVLCGRRDGLVASVSRIVHFGAVPDDIRRALEAVAQVDAAAIAASRPGRTTGDVFTDIQQAYEAAGFPGGWQGHHQGGVAAYEPREYLAVPGSEDILEEGMICAWNPSVPGAKSEDTILVGPDGGEVLTSTPGWPMVETTTPQRPGIFVR